MPGPLVHKAAMQNLQTMLARDGIYVDVGSAYDNIKADLDYDSHGWSIETMTGSIFDKIEAIVSRVKNKEYNSLDELYYLVRILCHFCTDTMSIGQISSVLWGKYDDRFDALGELVLNKNSRGVPDSDFGCDPDLKVWQKETMNIIYTSHIKICRKWNYCIKPEFRNMVRDCVYFGSYYAYHWCKRALQ